ncbi:MAG: PLP-dependent aminotransferase family protein [Actinomycetota bacterium]|nr:PLP-dependent aminotransferase family protein [Actinomycetota bacterium]
MRQELAALVATASPGTRLPATRELQRRFRVGPATVHRAVAELASKGLLRTQPGSGTFVSPRAPLAPSRSGDFDWQTLALGPALYGGEAVEANLDLPAAGMTALSTGYLDEQLQPIGLLARASARAARRPGAWSRPPLSGVDELRDIFARELGGDVERRHVLITAGSQPALASCFRSLAQPGATVVVESPTYQGALAAARAAGLVPLGVPADRAGIRVDLLSKALEKSGARLVYLQPRWLNPTGAQLSADRREALLELVKASQVFVIEDDPSLDLELEGRSFRPLVSADEDGHFIYLRSLTKGVAPALRIAALVSRGPVSRRLRQAQGVQSAFVSTVLQHTACEVLTAPEWPRHLGQVRQALRERRDTLVESLATFLPDWRVPEVPGCGLHLWVELPADADEDHLVSQSARAGVRVTAGRHYYPAEPAGPHLRLTFAAASSTTISEAVVATARVIGT